MSECTRCRGTGWANAARDSGMEDVPLMLRPLGVYRCTNCGGTGDTDLFARLTSAQREELEEAIRRAWEKVGARKTATEGHNAELTGVPPTDHTKGQ